MALDTYREIEAEAIDEKALADCSGKYVLIKDAQKKEVLFGGIFEFDMKEPNVYYLREESISRMGLVRNLEKIIVPLDA